MRCFSCGSFSIKPLCKDCIKDFLTPYMLKRDLNDLKVVSFFDYYLINELIKSKYSNNGYRMYKFFAQKFFSPFLIEYAKSFSKTIYLIGVDSNLDRGYSNISLLLHYGAKNITNIKPLYNVLKPKNRVQYAGKPLEFRLKNLRDFVYNGPKDIDAILIDDIITTGTTLKEATLVLKENNVNIHFALTVASTQDGIDY